MAYSHIEVLQLLGSEIIDKDEARLLLGVDQEIKETRRANNGNAR